MQKTIYSTKKYISLGGSKSDNFAEENQYNLIKRLSINTLCYTVTFSLIGISSHVTQSRPYHSTFPLYCRLLIQSFLLFCLTS